MVGADSKQFLRPESQKELVAEVQYSPKMHKYVTEIV